MENNWIEIMMSNTVEDMLKIIDDALCYLFEFKVENHKLYFRERTELST